MTTIDTYTAIRRLHNHREAERIARENCKNSVEGRGIEANGLDNGWSATGVYEMQDGGQITCDGRGWWCKLPDGREIFH